MLKNSIQQYISGISCREDDVLNIELEKAKNGNLLAADTIVLIEKIIDGDKNEQNILNNKHVEIEKHLEQVNARLGKAEEIGKARASLASAKETLQNTEPQLKELSDQYEKEKGKQPETDALSDSITTGRNKLPQYDELENTRKALAGKEKEQQKIESECSAWVTSLETETKQLETAKKELEELKEAGIEKEKLLGHKKALQERQNDLGKLSKDLKTYNKLSNELDVARKKYLDAMKKSESCHTEYSVKNKAFLEEQAPYIGFHAGRRFKVPCLRLNGASRACRTVTERSE
jgi:exonuclease SbcC